ncbi:uncharacterized protein METZ01_LOCUS175550 [marine metagenome]|uniref:Uncharacterized protein n=1 Tax=marine metagenome TaxID=408172 RepID=A0A382C9E7_9ZZZZ
MRKKPTLKKDIPLVSMLARCAQIAVTATGIIVASTSPKVHLMI